MGWGNNYMNSKPKSSKAFIKLALNVAVAGALLTSYGGRKAYAGTCTESFAGSGVWTCSGAAGADVTQSPTATVGGAMTVSTLALFGINTASGDAIRMMNAGADTDITFTDNNYSSITAQYTGILALNFGSGTTTVTSTGTVIGDSNGVGGGRGISARNYNGSGLTIDSRGDVSGGSDGINAFNTISGTATITNTATVTGDTNGNGIGNGIYVNNSGSDLTISAMGEVAGGDNGIIARNYGSGTATITNTATVTGDTNGSGSGNGIYVRNQNGTDLTIDVRADVSGGYRGVSSRNSSSGTTTITSTATVTGDSNGDGSGNGIYARNSGTNLTINVGGEVAGGYHGIYARNSGSGTTTITSIAMVTGDSSGDGNGNGILARNEGTDLTINTSAIILGGYSGISALNLGIGATTITTAAAVTGDTFGNGSGDGIYLYNETTSMGATLSINGNATGGEYGIQVRHYGSNALNITASTAVITGINYAGIATRTDSAGTGNVGTSNITLNTGAMVSGGSNAISNDAGASNVTVNIDATVTGNIILSDGSDNLTFTSSDFSAVTLFDGGDDIDTADGFIDVLTFANTSGSLIGANITNWEEVVIDASTIVFTDAMLTTGSLTVTNGAALDNTDGLALTGDLINTSIITMQDGDATDSTTVTANYTGGGILNLDTVLGDETSASDTLVITGDSSGNTTLNITNAGGIGVATAGDGILVVQVDGNSAGTFTLGTDLLADGFEYNLVQVGNNWFLQSQAQLGMPEAIPSLTNWGQLLLALLLGGLAWFRLPKLNTGMQAK